jgi:hypothetical protein
MRRFLSLVALSAIAGLAVATGASADPPQKVPIPPNGDLTLSGVCPFDVLLHTTDQKTHVRVYANGVLAGEGQLKVELTNLASAKTIALNVSGPGRFIPNDDGTTDVRFEGRDLFFFFADQISQGAPGALYLTTGLATETVDSATGVPVQGSFATTGSVTDLCAALA